MTDLISAKLQPGTSSWSFFSSVISSAGRTSPRVEAICPSLMNDGPRSWSTSRTRSPIEIRFFSASPRSSSSLGISGASDGGSVFLVRPKPARATISPKPWRTRTAEISRSRPRSRTALRTLTMRGTMLPLGRGAQRLGERLADALGEGARDRSAAGGRSGSSCHTRNEAADARVRSPSARRSASPSCASAIFSSGITIAIDADEPGGDRVREEALLRGERELAHIGELPFRRAGRRFDLVEIRPLDDRSLARHERALRARRQLLSRRPCRRP